MGKYYNSELTEKLLELKEKISGKTSQLERCKGKLSIHKEALSKQGYKNVEEAKKALIKIKKELEIKEQNIENKIEILENKIQ